MRRINDRMSLFGFLDAGLPPTFLVPVFTDGTDIYLQNADKADTITSFVLLPADAGERVTRRGPEIAYVEDARGIGDDALYAFQADKEIVTTGSRDVLGKHIKRLLAERKVDAFIRLELLEFIGASSVQLRNAILDGQSALDRSGIPQANAWARDQFAHHQIPYQDSSEATDSSTLTEGLVRRPLPLIYQSTSFEARQIMNTATIPPQFSKILQADRVVLLYGRAASETQSRQDAGSRADLPVLFLLDSSNLGTPAQYFPTRSLKFEPFSFCLSQEESAVARNSRQSSAELGGQESPRFIATTIAGAADFVSEYFDGDRAFVRGAPLDTERLRRELRRQNLKKDMPIFGDAIEVHFDQAIALNPSTLRALILPDFLLDDAGIIEFSKAMNCEVVNYHHDMFEQNPYIGLRTSLEQYLDRQGYLADDLDEFDGRGFHDLYK